MSDCEDAERNFEDLKRALAKIDIYVDMVKKRLTEVNELDDLKIPGLLENISLRDYQVEGFRWINTLYENGMNGILADEMGLGKTVQVIAALCNLIESGVPGPFLVVAPLSLLSGWSDQLAAFAPRVPCMVYYGSLQERLYLRKQIRRRVKISLDEPILPCMSPSDSQTIIQSSDISSNPSLDFSVSVNTKMDQNSDNLETSHAASTLASSSFIEPPSNVFGNSFQSCARFSINGQLKKGSGSHRDDNLVRGSSREQLLQNLDDTITSVIEKYSIHEELNYRLDRNNSSERMQDLRECGSNNSLVDPHKCSAESNENSRTASVDCRVNKAEDDVNSSKPISYVDTNSGYLGDRTKEWLSESVSNMKPSPPKPITLTENNEKEEKHQHLSIELHGLDSKNQSNELDGNDYLLQNAESNCDSISLVCMSTNSENRMGDPKVPIKVQNFELAGLEGREEKTEIVMVLRENVKSEKEEKEASIPAHNDFTEIPVDGDKSVQCMEGVIPLTTNEEKEETCHLNPHNNGIGDESSNSGPFRNNPSVSEQTAHPGNSDFKDKQIIDNHEDSQLHVNESADRSNIVRRFYWTCPVVMTSYDVAMRDAKYLQNIPFKALIVDEGQRLKNPFCRLYKRLAKFSTGLRLLVTGTPLQNRLSELWSLLHFILPEIFTSMEMFACWFDPKALNDISNLDRLAVAEIERSLITNLHQIIHPFMLRRSKVHAKLCIPPKREVLLYAKMTDLQQKVYDYAVKHFLSNSKKKSDPGRKTGTGSLTWLDPSNIIPYPSNTIKRRKKAAISSKILTRFARQALLSKHRDSKKNDSNMDPNACGRNESTSLNVSTQDFEFGFSFLPYLSLNNGVMLLRRIVNHPYLAIERPELPQTNPSEASETEAHPNDKECNHADQDLIAASGKTILVERLLTILISSGHKVIIFSQLTMILDLLEELLDAKSWAYVRLDGMTKFSERQDAIRRFNYEPVDQLPIFLISTRAGGTGLNLQAAADTVIIFDSDWNPQTDLQAQDRCHRIGQTKPVLIIRLVTINSIDEFILRRAQAKRGLERLILTTNSKLIGSLLQSTNADGDSGASKNPEHLVRQKREWKSSESNGQSSLNPEHNPKFGLTKPELLGLFNKKDHHREMQVENFITDDILNALIDRSDLYDLWEKQKNGLDITPVSEIICPNSSSLSTTLVFPEVNSTAEEDNRPNEIPTSPRKTRSAAKRDHNGLVMGDFPKEKHEQLRYNMRNREP